MRLMFPMISGMSELLTAKQVLDDCKAELRRRGQAFDDKLPIGVMIEMPSAVMTADHLAGEVDFFSIGTNDLIQYTMAIDRGNEAVGYLYQPLHPALLRMVKLVTDAARARGIPVAMCGEMAGEPLLAAVLLGLGLTELSMNAAAIPMVKSVLRAVSAADARRLAERCLAMPSTEHVERLVKEHMAQVIPE
jgi:phosphotransferase system enzyme I (PtsI)